MKGYLKIEILESGEMQAETNFSDADPISRLEVAAMVIRSLKLDGVPGSVLIPALKVMTELHEHAGSASIDFSELSKLGEK